MEIELRICQKQNEISHQGKIIFSETDFVIFTINSTELNKLKNKNEVKSESQDNKITHILKIKNH